MYRSPYLLFDNFVPEFSDLVLSHELARYV